MQKLILILLVLISFDLHAERKKVGLVLGGGGAKGAAHIGVLQVLEEAGIPVDYIAGTSIGAIVGGLYAIGYDAHSLDSLVRRMDWSFLLSNRTPQRYRSSFRDRTVKGRYVVSYPYSLKKKNEIPAGVISGQNILNLFSGLTIGYHHVPSFTELPIPFYCVATDLVSENYIVLKQGSLPLSMRSSMSIPGVFMPVETDSTVLVDGGVLNNFPTNVVREMGADLIIGVDLNTGKVPVSQMSTMLGLIDALTSIAGKNEYEKNKEGLALYLNPDLKGFQTMEFNAAAMDSMYQRGVAAAREQWTALMALKKTIYGDTIPATDPTPADRSREHYRPGDTLQLGSISISGVGKNTERLIRERIELRENSRITLRNIDEAIATLDGMDVFSSVTYRLTDRPPYDITFLLKEQPLNDLNFGIRFDSEQLASLLLNTSFYENFFRGSLFSVTAKLNICPYLELQYAWRPNFSSRIALSYRIGYQNFDLYNGRHKAGNIYYLWQTGTLEYEILLKNWELDAGLRWAYFGKSSRLFTPDYQPAPAPDRSFFNYFAKAGINTLDNLYYPTRGIDASLKTELVTTDLIRNEGHPPFGTFAFHVRVPVRLHPKLALLPELAGRIIAGKHIPAIYRNYGGGSMAGRYIPQQIAIPGVRCIQVLDNSLLSFRLGFRYNLLKKQYLFLNGGYAKTAKNLGSMHTGLNIWSAGVRYSYNSFIGPVGGEVNYSNRDKGVSVYLNIGYDF